MIRPPLPRPLAGRARRAYGIALVLIVLTVSGALISLTVDRLLFIQRRHVQLSDRHAARASLDAALARLAATASAWIALPGMTATWRFGDYDVEIALVPFEDHATLPQDERIAYRALRLRTRPVAVAPAAPGDGPIRRERVQGLERRYVAAARDGEPLRFLLVDDRTIEIPPIGGRPDQE